uniref:C2H2-type domain-containing protein n=1 Tax=Cacopsylla melanoneura TaxID=428564 RepID=A0A8D8Z977_9HEMI
MGILNIMARLCLVADMTPSPSSSEHDDSDRDPDYSLGQGDEKMRHIARTFSEQDDHVEDDDEDGHVDKDGSEYDDDSVDGDDKDDDDRDDENDDVTVINRGRFCYFCEKKVTKMKRHLFAKHANEKEMEEMEKKQ